VLTDQNARVYLCGASYVLGEKEVGYADIPGLPGFAASFGLVPDAGLWGWGTVRTTERDLADMAADTGRQTLLAAGTDPSAVDALVLCSTRVPGPAEGHGGFLARVLTGIGLGDLPCYGQSLNRCVTLLAGIDVARAFVLAGRYRRVLVITVDAVAEGAAPMSQFALFSDGAASCLVSGDPGCADPGCADPGCAGPGAAGSYEVLGCAVAQETATLEWTSQISSDLARQVNERLLVPPGIKLGDVTALLHVNLFKPLLVMKERQAGFREDQLYLDNIPRIGHCYAADPLINLVDRAALGHLLEGHYCMLAASVPGSRFGVLLKKIC
jgi:3-oxoacyl-[acyl-carrier-protein] synthase III